MNRDSYGVTLLATPGYKKLPVYKDHDIPRGELLNSMSYVSPNRVEKLERELARGLHGLGLGEVSGASYQSQTIPGNSNTPLLLLDNGRPRIEYSWPTSKYNNKQSTAVHIADARLNRPELLSSHSPAGSGYNSHPLTYSSAPSPARATASKDEYSSRVPVTGSEYLTSDLTSVDREYASRVGDRSPYPVSRNYPKYSDAWVKDKHNVSNTHNSLSYPRDIAHRADKTPRIDLPLSSFTPHTIGNSLSRRLEKNPGYLSTEALRLIRGDLRINRHNNQPSRVHRHVAIDPAISSSNKDNQSVFNTTDNGKLSTKSKRAVRLAPSIESRLRDTNFKNTSLRSRNSLNALRPASPITRYDKVSWRDDPLVNREELIKAKERVLRMNRKVTGDPQSSTGNSYSSNGSNENSYESSGTSYGTNYNSYESSGNYYGTNYNSYGSNGNSYKFNENSSSSPNYLSGNSSESLKSYSDRYRSSRHGEHSIGNSSGERNGVNTRDTDNRTLCPKVSTVFVDDAYVRSMYRTVEPVDDDTAEGGTGRDDYLGREGLRRLRDNALNERRRSIERSASGAPHRVGTDAKYAEPMTPGAVGGTESRNVVRNIYTGDTIDLGAGLTVNPSNGRSYVQRFADNAPPVTAKRGLATTSTGIGIDTDRFLEEPYKIDHSKRIYDDNTLISANMGMLYNSYIFIYMNSQM